MTVLLRTVRRAGAVALISGLVAACASSPLAPRVGFDEPFTLAPAESAAIGSSRVVVTFLGVSGDSRCPADAICIQGGDAIVQLQVDDPLQARATYDLHTGDQTRASVRHRDLRITLVELAPYPFASRPFPPSEYRATLRVTR